jgi:hypothetical protein
MKSKDRVNFHEANVLAGQVVRGGITTDDAEHRLYQYWETRITPKQAAVKLLRCVDAIRGQS